MNTPNLLTALRIVLIPVFFGLLIYQKFFPALAVFILAGVTDVLDGIIARSTNQKTKIGTVLDPMADKLLSVTSFVTLSILGFIPPWIVVIFISRDVMISLGSLIIYISEEQLEVVPSRIGKATTFFQFLTIVSTLAVQITGIGHLLWRTALWIAVLLTVFSGLQYLSRGLELTKKRTP